MKKIYCDFCGIEFDETKRETWIRWNKIIFSIVGNRPLGDKTFDACEECGKRIASLVDVIHKMYGNLIQYDNTGKRPIYSKETMKELRSVLDIFYMRVSEQCNWHVHRKDEVFMKCPACVKKGGTEVEMEPVGFVGPKWYFTCPVCEFTVEFVQTNKELCLGGSRRIN